MIQRKWWKSVSKQAMEYLKQKGTSKSGTSGFHHWVVFAYFIKDVLARNWWDQMHLQEKLKFLGSLRPKLYWVNSTYRIYNNKDKTFK